MKGLPVTVNPSSTILQVRKLNPGRWSLVSDTHSVWCHTARWWQKHVPYHLISYPVNQSVSFYTEMIVERTHTLPSEGSSTLSLLSHPQGFTLRSLGPSLYFTSVIFAAACWPLCLASITRTSETHSFFLPPVGMLSGTN